jgi:hypothetical protein
VAALMVATMVAGTWTVVEAEAVAEIALAVQSVFPFITEA